MSSTMDILSERTDAKQAIADRTAAYTDAAGRSTARPGGTCFHCGAHLRGSTIKGHDKSFCCQGCLAVFEILKEGGLDDFYRLEASPGIRLGATPREGEFNYLNNQSIRLRLVDYSDDRITRVTFHIPAMHCIACVWLLENLFRLKPGIRHSQVTFPRKEVVITFENAALSLGGLVALLASIGYMPELKLADLDRGRRAPISRRLWLQLGVAGFSFGNIMLLSIASYFGLDGFSGPALNRMFGYASLVLALPVVFYSAADYWSAAWLAVRRRVLTIDVPIALGIAALTAWSTGEVIAGHGAAYFDSLAGLTFFLLCGRAFQQRAYDRLSFDRDYRSFFPLAITRKSGRREEQVSLAELSVGDRLIVRNGELIPADARLISGRGMIDYSFVTGESEPVEKLQGDHVYAGGRQMGGAIEIETVKEVSQSHLTSLWNQPAFAKDKPPALDALTNRYSRRFTKMVLAIALGAAAFWTYSDPGRALLSFVSVLIVACPCALALASPFTLGAAQRVLGRLNVFVKNPAVIETLSRVDTIVFDKTGTLTAAGSVSFHGDPLNNSEALIVRSLALHSVHPYSVRIGEYLAGEQHALRVRSFCEVPGQGIRGEVAVRRVLIGSATWLESQDIHVTRAEAAPGSSVHLAFDGQYRGCFKLGSELREQTDALIRNLSGRYDLALLSGDNAKERGRFQELFGKSDHLHFNQSPLNKLEFIRDLQASGKTVLMVGDGLNDAGALRQSDAGAAVVESMSAFSPASDVIMSAGMVARFPEMLRFARAAVKVVYLSFFISGLYNVLGISLAVRGQLSPMICAILMPLSSLTVVMFACGTTNWLGRRIFKSAASAEIFNPESQS